MIRCERRRRNLIIVRQVRNGSVELSTRNTQRLRSMTARAGFGARKTITTILVFFVADSSPLRNKTAFKRHLILDRECAPTLDPELVALDDTVVQAVPCDRLVDFV